MLSRYIKDDSAPSPGFYEGLVRDLFGHAGITINGPRDIDPQMDAKYISTFCRRLAWTGVIGLGDSYMEGRWTCENLAEFTNQAISHGLLTWSLRTPLGFYKNLIAKMFNRQRRRRAVKNVEAHYVTYDDLVLAMTDPWHAYSCAFFADHTNPVEGLNVAQERKLDLICTKLGLEADHRYLDIGCGWGSMLGYAQQHYGVHGMGITPAPNQAEYVRTHFDLKVFEGDYRDFPRNGECDRISSVGMFEHVGRKNWRTYMQVVSELLAPKGRFCLHFFGRRNSNVALPETWIDKHIFPGYDLPTLQQVAIAADGLLNIATFEDKGQNYDPTLMLWAENFIASDAGKELKVNDPEKYRMWMFYLYYSAGGFRSGVLTLWQLVMQQGDNFSPNTFNGHAFPRELMEAA